MRRGTTPTITCTLSTDIDLAECELIRVIIRQGGHVKLIKEADDITIQDKTISVRLSQEETFAFYQGSADIQVRIKASDAVYATGIKSIRVDTSLDEEVL
ncbi:hypothetical protein [Absicoccus porci]|uniref:hypothetical protein n=1 Tax=Absicoccus porci TaxID=2486576 RepID=UPI0023F2E40D|nr:hypothetical protein [Absicoccus porci]